RRLRFDPGAILELGQEAVLMAGGVMEEITNELGARIKVVGVGGGGGNALNTMILAGLTGVDFIAANTDCQALQHNRASGKIQLGAQVTKGLGAGANPEIGRQAALEDRDRILAALEGADMVFVTAGMGGGTGTGGAPIIADLARSVGALTVGVVTKPFVFEGKRRLKQAEHGISELKGTFDTLITIPNQRLLAVTDQNTTLLDTFKKAAHEDANIIFGSVIDDEMGDELKITVIATGFATRDARRIERTDATRIVRGAPQGSLALPQVTEPGPIARVQRTPEIARAATPSPGPAKAGTPPPPPARTPTPDRPVRHISWDELRQMTGATEDELDIPTFLRNGE